MPLLTYLSIHILQKINLQYLHVLIQIVDVMFLPDLIKICQQVESFWLPIAEGACAQFVCYHCASKHKFRLILIPRVVSYQLSLFLKMDDKLHRHLSCDIFPSKQRLPEAITINGKRLDYKSMEKKPPICSLV